MGSACSRGGIATRERSVRVTEDRSVPSKGLREAELDQARHSKSAPSLLPKQQAAPPGHAPVPGSPQPQEVQEMIRQFTRKSLSSEGLAPHLDTGGAIAAAVAGRRGPRRDSRIDDKDVLELITSKSHKNGDKEYQEIKHLAERVAHGEDLDLGTAPPEVAARVQRRRQTMEKLDVFSPDTAPERLEELYEATEKLIAKEDREEALKHTTETKGTVPSAPKR